MMVDEPSPGVGAPAPFTKAGLKGLTGLRKISLAGKIKSVSNVTARRRILRENTMQEWPLPDVN